MTEEELIERLEALAERSRESDGDPEMCHIAADKALLDHIGSEGVTEAFKSVYRWYA